MTTKALTTTTATTISSYFKKNMKEIASALPDHMSADRLARVCINAISVNPKLAECHPTSLFRAMVASGMLGLEPNTPLGHAYLVPFKNNQKGITEVTFMLGYKGLIDLSHRLGTVCTLNAHEVHENDFFEFEYGTDQKLIHKPEYKKDRGEFIGAYAVYKNRNGGQDFEFMTKTEIEKVRNSASSKNSGPWTKWYEEMAKKTVLKRLLKRIPLSLEIQKAVALDNAQEGGKPNEVNEVMDDIIDVDIVIDNENEESNASDTAEETKTEAPEGVFYQEILDAGITVEKFAQYMQVTGSMNADETLEDLPSELKEHVRSKAKEYINEINS